VLLFGVTFGGAVGIIAAEVGASPAVATAAVLRSGSSWWLYPVAGAAGSVRAGAGWTAVAGGARAEERVADGTAVCLPNPWVTG
jgi:hypothetical protein